MPRATTPIIITPLRKQALLVEARRNRVEWVDESASPYKVAGSTTSSRKQWIELFLKESDEGLPSSSSSQHQPCQEDVIKGDTSKPSSTTNPSVALEYDNTDDDDGLDLLRKSRVCAAMKSAITIVSTLYSDIPASKIEERIVRQMMSQLSTKDVKAILSSSSKKKKKNEMKDTTALLTQKLPVLLKSTSGYDAFIQWLRSPEAADLVQELKHFVSSLEASTSKKLQIPKEQQQQEQQHQKHKSQVAVETAASIHAFLDKQTQNLKSHVLWQTESDEEFHLNCKIPMETFLFQKLYKILWKLTCDTESDSHVADKIQSLQFISWEHLDIPYPTTTTTTANSKVESSSSVTTAEEAHHNDDAWSVSLDALRFVDAQWSPTAKLVLLVEAYRGITTALTANIQQQQKEQSVLLGADDSLPALILAILQAKPDNVMSNLQFIQTMARPDLLRGELGYVLTSVFSAIHFIMDIKDSSSLTISQEEFALGLSKSLEEHKKNNKRSSNEGQNREDASIFGTSTDLLDAAVESSSAIEDKNGERRQTVASAKEHIEITPRDIRRARNEGENIDLEWALRYQAAAAASRREQSSPMGEGVDESSNHDANNGSRFEQEKNGSTASSTTERPFSATSMIYNALPQGFTRTYSFLGVPPEDIRVSDIPLLLHEYNQLVRVCENLLSEKNAKLVAEHKRRLKTVREQLESEAAAVDFPRK